MLTSRTEASTRCGNSGIFESRKPGNAENGAKSRVGVPYGIWQESVYKISVLDLEFEARKGIKFIRARKSIVETCPPPTSRYNFSIQPPIPNTIYLR